MTLKEVKEELGKDRNIVVLDKGKAVQMDNALDDKRVQSIYVDYENDSIVTA